MHKWDGSVEMAFLCKSEKSQLSNLKHIHIPTVTLPQWEERTLSGEQPTLFCWQVLLLEDPLKHWILPGATCFNDLLHMMKVDVSVPKKLRMALLQTILGLEL